MKKILAMLALLSITSNATEVFSEYYVMEKVIPLLTNAESYTLNGEEVKDVAAVRKYLFEKTKIGDTVKVTYYRNGKENTTSVVVQALNTR